MTEQHGGSQVCVHLHVCMCEGERSYYKQYLKEMSCEDDCNASMEIDVHEKLVIFGIKYRAPIIHLSFSS